MKTELLTMGHLPDRRSFIGSSDARVIMGDNEAALLRLWRDGAKSSPRTCPATSSSKLA